MLEPFQRLIDRDELIGHPYSGFWKSMDTFKDKQQLDDLYAKGRAPWEVWKPELTARKGASNARVSPPTSHEEEGQSIAVPKPG